MKWGIVLIVLVCGLFLFGCSNTKVKSCGYEINEMADITGEIIDTHVIVDKSSTPSQEKTIVTIRTANCDVFALKESIEYQRTKSEDTWLKVHKTCIQENSGAVSFKGLYREYTTEGFTYDITPSFCSKTSENVAVNVTN